MAKSKRFIACDMGASNGRVFTADFDGKVIELREAYRFENTPYRLAGSLYWNVLGLYVETGKGIRKACEGGAEIASAGIDTWGVDFGFLDSSGVPVADPLHYRDEARVKAFDEVTQYIPSRELFAATGVFVLPIDSLFNLYALKKRGATEYATAARYLHTPDLLNYFFTGVARNEYTIATTSLMYDLKEMKWNTELLSRLHLRSDFFCEEVFPGAVIGPMNEESRQTFDLPPMTISAVASHDTASAVAALPITADDAFLILGTWGVCGSSTDEPLMEVAAMQQGFGNEGSATGRSFLARNITGLWIVQGCRESWRKERPGISWEEITRATLDAPSMRAFIDVDNPMFSPADVHMPKAVQSYCAQTGQDLDASVGAIARAVYESLVLRCKQRIVTLEVLTGRRFQRILVGGGGVKNEFLCQWIADATDKIVLAGPAELTVLGNVLMQLVANGEARDHSEALEIGKRSVPFRRYQPKDSSIWDEAMERFQKIIDER